MAAEQDDVLAAIEEHTKAVDGSLGGMKKTVADLEKRLKLEGEEREALERKFNMLRVTGAGAANDPEVERAPARFSAAVKTLFPGRLRDDLSAEQFAEYAKGFAAYVRAGDRALSIEHVKAMQVGVDSEGGYLVPVDMSGRIATRIRELSPIRQFANVQPIGSDRLEGIEDLDETDSGWVGETATRDDTDTPDVGKYQIPVHEIYAQPKATQKLIDDSMIDLEAWLSAKVGDRFARQEAAAFISGDGIVKPRGILTYTAVATGDATRAWGQLQYIPSGHASTFVTPTTSVSPADCLITTVYALKAPYRTGARWFMNSATTGAIRKFKDADGRFIWQDPISEGQPPLLLGYPVSFAEDLPDVGANEFPIIFGNLMIAYQIVDRLGVRMLRDPYTQKGFVKFYTIKRVGGAVVNFEALKLLKIAAT